MRIETYVRSFENAVQLSLIQGCYKEIDQSSILWSDYGKMEVTSDEIFNGSIAPRIKEIANDFLEKYRNFARDHEEGIYIKGETSDNLTKAYISLTDDEIRVTFEDYLYFKGKIKNSKFNRVYKPSAALPSKLKKVWDSIQDFLESDKVGKKIEELSIAENECNVSFVEQKVKNKLKSARKDFNRDHDIENITMTMLNVVSVRVKKVYDESGFECCQINVTFRGGVFDKNYIYPVSPKIGVINNSYLGLIFKARSGNADECIYKPYCIDEDSGEENPHYVKGKIKYDGSEEYDECVNETTLLERICVGDSPSYEYYDCPFGCEDGKCKYECEKNEDCFDDNPCTGPDECVDGFCQRPYREEGYVCGYVMKSCPSSCEDGVEKISLGDAVCEMTCDGAGNCQYCEPECSYVTKTCRYGCKDSTSCWQGLWCPAKKCVSTDNSGLCQGTSDCTTEAKCIAEYESKPTCSYYGGAYKFCCIPGVDCGSPCSWCCCWDHVETCVANCYFNETCTYSD